MRKMQRSSLASQKGSFYLNILVFAMIIVLLVCGMKIGPAYLDNRTIVNVLERMASTGELRDMTLTQTRTNVMRALNTNNIRDFESNAITESREGDLEFIDVNYEKRIHLFKNIDAMVSFSERVAKY